MPPYNGSGTYTLTAGQPVVAGTDILDSTFNTLTADLATALSTCVTRDGQSPPTTNLPMGSFKLTGLAAGTAAGHSVRFEQLQTGVNKLITVAGTGDVITGVMTPTYGAYTNGDMFTFIVGSTNTTNVTINIDGLGAKAITNGTTALTAGALTANRVVVIQYDGTRFQLLNSYLVTPITGATGSTVVPVGTTAQRDAAPSAGYVRYNTTTATFEGYGSAWGALGGADYLNTTRIDVASATTLDLTANAPSTRNIRLTGTTAITGVTVAIGQTYFVVASGAFTLTNNASIVTNTGANIVAAVGDSFILRSTAANTVEVIEYASIILPVANGGTGVATKTGTGAVVLGTSPTLTTPVINSATFATVSGTAPIYGCRAWVNFDGTTATPCTIRGSGNVTSVTKNGTGDYTVNFTTAMSDANYSVCCSAQNSAATNGANVQRNVVPYTYAAGSVSLNSATTNLGTLQDMMAISVAIFR